MSTLLGKRPRPFGHYKIWFHFEARARIRVRARVNPPALPTLLHYYCTTIAQYTTPLRPPVCMPYAIQYRPRQYRVKANRPSPVSIWPSLK